jgi:hypothetical protein
MPDPMIIKTLRILNIPPTPLMPKPRIEEIKLYSSADEKNNDCTTLMKKQVTISSGVKTKNRPIIYFDLDAL